MTFIEQRGSLADDVRREWPLEGADPDADLRAWRQGCELYEDDDSDDALLRAGGLIARALRHHVHGEPVLREDDLAVSVHSLLFAATEPTLDEAQAAEAHRLARLALVLTKQHGWQPVAAGGNGQIAPELFEDADIREALAAAIAPTDLTAFFLS